MLSEYRTVTEQEKAEVVALGGLHVVGTERHESRRIDNQLRGRSGRQGDPGSTRFFLSLEDPLFRWGGCVYISVCVCVITSVWVCVCVCVCVCVQERKRVCVCVCARV
jgi:hypothetical protein